MWVQQKCIKAARYSPTEFVIDSHEYVIDDIIDGLQTWGRYVQVYCAQWPGEHYLALTCCC